MTIDIATIISEIGIANQTPVIPIIEGKISRKITMKIISRDIVIQVAIFTLSDVWKYVIITKLKPINKYAV